VPENAITVIGEGARPSSTNAWSDERRGTDQHADRLPVRYIGDTSAIHRRHIGDTSATLGVRS